MSVKLVQAVVDNILARGVTQDSDFNAIIKARGVNVSAGEVDEIARLVDAQKNGKLVDNHHLADHFTPVTNQPTNLKHVFAQSFENTVTLGYAIAAGAAYAGNPSSARQFFGAIVGTLMLPLTATLGVFVGAAQVLKD